MVLRQSGEGMPVWTGISLLFLAFAVSLDSFGVGVTYGLRKIRIPLLSILVITCFSGGMILFSMSVGHGLATWLSLRSPMGLAR